MISPARKLAYKLLLRIDAGRLFSDDALNSEEMEKLEVRDRHLTTEIVYGTLRWQGLLDYVWAKASSRPFAEVEPGARILLRMSLYQMWRMDRIPDHALVNDAVEMAKKEIGKGTDRYINGILRHLSRTKPWIQEDFLKGAPHYDRASLPRWLWRRWADRFGKSRAAEYAASLNEIPRPAIRLNEFQTEGLPDGFVPSDIVPHAGSVPPGTHEHGSGLQYQDEASQLVPYLLGPAGGYRIWDACAAPGGKAAVLDRLVAPGGRVVASDSRKERVSRMADLFNRVGADRLDVVAADACVPAPFGILFDAVLADVPCSGLGTLRRNPEIKWQLRQENLPVLQQLQMRILDSVSEAVRPGGLLLYSTCSTEPEENEAVVNSFLQKHGDFRLKRPVDPPGIEHWVCDDRMVRTFPGTRLWDGFFAALMMRSPR